MGLLAGLVLLLLAFGARAQPGTAELTDYGIDSLRYEAAPGCPDLETFLRRAREHLSGAAAAAEPRRQLRVTLRPLSEGASGELTLSAEGRVVARRALEAADCGQAADALALILALTLEPNEPLASPRQPPAVARRASRGAHAVRRPAAPQLDPPAPAVAAPAQTDAGAPPAPAGPPPQPEPPAPAPESAPSPEVDSGPSPLPAAPPSPTVEPPAPVSEGHVPHLGGLASAGALSGVMPSWRPLFAASLRASWALPSRWGVSLGAGVRLAPGESVTKDAGRAEFRWWAADLAACVGWLPVEPLEVAACADAEVGRLTVRGRDTRDPRRSARPWTALGPTLVVGWRLFPPISLRLAGGALWPFTRDRYLLADELVHRPARVGARLELGIEARFW